jgi:hypothetical protein
MTTPRENIQSTTNKENYVEVDFSEKDLWDNK